MNGFKLHLFHSQVDELIQSIPVEDLLDGRFEERDDYYSELYLELDPGSEAAQKLVNNNRVLLQLPNSEFREFVLYEPETDHASKSVRMSASFLNLDKEKIILPFSLLAQTNQMMLTNFLVDTEWNVGVVEFAGIQPYTIENHIGVYTAIRNMADFFNLQIRFRIEYEGGQIVRYVDMAFDFGEFNGVEITDNNGLVNLRIKESTDVITSLLCVAKDHNDIVFEVTVSDAKSRNQYGRYGEHLWGVLEISEKGLTRYQVQAIGEKELAKKSRKVTEISSEQIDMYGLTGNEYDRLDLRDFVRLISNEHKPAIRLQARVVGINHSITDPSDRKLTIGEYIEYR